MCYKTQIGLCDSDDCQICFTRSFANHEKSQFWIYELNNTIPRQITYSSGKKFWFLCDKCPHKFQKRITHISEGSWCPYCVGQKLCDSDDCQICFNKSFASHEKSQFWNYELNEIIPRQITYSSGKKFWFSCNNCNHNFLKRLNNVSRGVWCPYCNASKLCDDDCQICFNKSFASHEKSQFWIYELNNTIPRQVTKHSDKKYWFNCNICNNNFNCSTSNVSNGKWCPYCKNKTELKLFQWMKNESTITNIQKEKKFIWAKNINLLRFDFVFKFKEIDFICELDGRQHFQSNFFNNTDKDLYKIQKSDVYKAQKCIENGFKMIRIFQQDVWDDTSCWKECFLNAINQLATNEIQNIICLDFNRNLYINHPISHIGI
jgi:DNA-directed RNA polymerase subunit RPC12/RpoP